jgi:carbon-monoxide dehydrogenase medium subunit
MKLPRFEYVAPHSLKEVLASLAAAKGGAKLLAGGQSLLPTMAFRLAAPSLLVDLRNVPELDRIEINEGRVHVGAKVRWCDIQKDARLEKAHPLLTHAVSHVAHYQIRNRGTVGGSLAHADPAAELPGIAVTCDAGIVIAGPEGSRTLPADQFFLGTLATALAADEVVLRLEFPGWPARRKWGFAEFARRLGDFALAGVALFYDLDAQQRACNSHIGVIGACARPHRLRDAERILDGARLDASTIEAVAHATAAGTQPMDDLHATASYRRALVNTMTERALIQSIQS